MTIHDFIWLGYLLGQVVELMAVGSCLVDPAIEAGDIDNAIVMVEI